MEARDIGAILRRERLAKKLSLDVIHSRTRIPPRFLEAIEDGDFERLPGLIFTRNFVRQYCEALGTDSTELLAAIPVIEESTLKLPDPPAVPKARRWNIQNTSPSASVAWLFMAVIAGMGGYLYFNHSRLAHAAVPGPSRRAEAKPVTKADSDRAAVVRAAQPQTTQPQATQPQIGISPAKEPSPIRVIVSARERSWVSVTADGKSAFVGTLSPNESKEISASDQVKLVTGNAGGLAVSLNGKALDSLGETGQVRVVKLTAEGPEFQQKAPPRAVDDAL